jgi:pimeloyl-ACP methyl ester carboxylesterase
VRKFVVGAVLLLASVPLVVAVLLPKDTARLLVDLERARAGLSPGVVTIAGEPWHFLEGGPADGEVLLLVHGFGGDKDNWMRFSRTLTDTYRVLIPDLPGFGESNRHWDWDYSARAQATRLQEFVQVLDLERFHLAGHSMGGHIAGLFAEMSPEQVQSLALITNGGVESPAQSYVAVRAQEGELILIPRTREEFQRLLEVASYEPPFIPWPVGGLLADESIADADFKEYVLGTLRQQGENDRLEPVLPVLNIPVFVLWGRHDRLIDVSTVEVIRNLVPDATYVIMEESGHLPMVEQPDVAADHYRKFLDAN